jgi:hypothetical protein
MSRNDTPEAFSVVASAVAVAALVETALDAIRTPVYLHVAFQQMSFGFHRVEPRKFLNP